MKNKKATLILSICAVIVIIVLAIVFIGQRPEQVPTPTATDAPVTEAPTATPEPTATPDPTPEPFVTFETAYIPLRFPSVYSEYIVQTQEAVGDISHEIFSMAVHNKTYEIFRITFGDISSGDYLGIFKTENSAIPVCSTVVSYTAEQLEELGTYDLYYALMDGVNTMLDSIYTNDHFEKDAVLISNESTEAKVNHWAVSLPSEMSWEETTAEDSYHADFYGTVAGSKIKLYSIHIDDSEQEDALGQYTLNGEKKIIYIESYPLEEQESWSEQDMIAAGTQMDTINEIIPAIMADKNFSVNIEPEF